MCYYVAEQNTDFRRCLNTISDCGSKAFKIRALAIEKRSIHIPTVDVYGISWNGELVDGRRLKV